MSCAGDRKGWRLPALYRKALRDLWLLRGQALAIMLVVAGGIAMLVMSQVALDTLNNSRLRFYEAQRLSDIWVDAKRAPEAVARQVAALPEVAEVESRVQAFAKLKLPGFDEPVSAQMISLPDDGGQPLMNGLHLRQGRLPAVLSRDEVVVSDAFAERHGLKPGDRLRATVNGHAQWFRLVGVATSPEFLYPIKPGAIFADHKHYAILWMPRRVLEAAMNMAGAFNQLVVKLALERQDRVQDAVPGAGEQERTSGGAAPRVGRHNAADAALARARQEATAIDAIERLMERWGGLEAVGRMQQTSYRVLHEELAQLRSMVRVMPTIFLAVAAFLLNVVFTRLVGTQRAQIAILKAFGYRTWEVALHYGLMAAIVCVAGALLGALAGAGLGQGLASLYQDNFRFPALYFSLDGQVVLVGVAVAVLAGVGGAGWAVLRSSREPVAQAMRPQAPERFRAAGFENWRLVRGLSQPVRMVLRQLERRPGRALLSVLGLAMAGSLIILAGMQKGTLSYLVDSQYRLAELYDMSVTFVEERSPQAVHELRSIRGVQHAEPTRSVPVELSFRSHRIRTVVWGLPADGLLQQPVNDRLQRVPLPPDGLVMNAYLAERLGLKEGDLLTVRQLQGRRRVLQVPVARLINENLGSRVYMNRQALNRLLGDGDVLTGALLEIRPGAAPAVVRALDERPQVMASDDRLDAIRAMFQMVERVSGPMTLLGVLLGCVVNFGVVYNAVRITLAERSRELASLRVLGFTRGEVARILLGEIGVLVVVSIPLSFVFGWLQCWYMAKGMQNELYRIPVHVPMGSYMMAALATLGSALVSMVVVLRLVNRLDMVEALKNRE